MTLPRWLASRTNPRKIAPRVYVLSLLMTGLFLVHEHAPVVLIYWVTAMAVPFAMEHGEENR